MPTESRLQKKVESLKKIQEIDLKIEGEPEFHSAKN